MDAVRRDVSEMERMVEAYLNFARDLATGEEPQTIDISLLLKTVVNETARAHGPDRLRADIKEGLTIAARRDALKRAVNNLVANGLKYADHVWMSAARVNDNLEIIVDDEQAGSVAEAIVKSANTGKIGDGKVFVSPVEEAIRIRTGETGSSAVAVN